KGLVYCAAVPNHTLITRRNGSVLISSNCWAYSTGGAIQALRAWTGAKHIPLNPHSVASIIKQGRDEGGWCGLSAEFNRNYGIVPTSMWPTHSRDYKRYWTEEAKKEAAKYRVTEDWVDIN